MATVQGPVTMDRRAGRPRSEEGRTAILRAAYDVLAAEGIGGFTIGRVAAEAGVGRPTIYRWWKSKGDLAVECFREHVLPNITVRRTDDPSADLQRFLAQSMRLLDCEEARILCGILAEGQRCDVTLGEIRTHYIAVRRQEAADIIRDGIAGGVFRADIDADAVFAFLIAPVLYRSMLGMPAAPGFADAACRLLMDGVRRPPG